MFLKELGGWIFTIIAAVMISLLIRSYVFASPEIQQDSMQNTLFEGQRVIEYKIEFLYSKPKRNDVVIINRELKTGFVNTLIENSRDFFSTFSLKSSLINQKRLIKRIIGVPGDIIEIKDGNVYINDKIISEPFVKGKTNTNGMKFPVKIPDNKYFVMGDNREVSLDSRKLGLIDRTNIEGKAILRVWPINKFGGI